MIYTCRENLTVLELQGDLDIVGFDRLSDLIMERPSNMIYCENGGVLYGIISMGDIARARELGDTAVAVNKRFTKLSGYEYMRAKRIFHEKEKINALPIVDSENKLIGDYTRWEDAICNFDFDAKENRRYAGAVKKAALVKPGELFPKKKERMEQWKNFYAKVGIETEVIARGNIEEAFGRNDIVLFADEDEKRGLGTLYRDILGKTFDWNKAKTFDMVAGVFEESVVDVSGFMREIAESGVFLMTIQIKEKESNYWKAFHKDIEHKFFSIGKEEKDILYEEFWENFFDDIYSYQYAKEISNLSFLTEKSAGIVRLKDADTKFFHVKDGERKTVGQPEEYKKSIYFFGPCLVFGMRTEDAHTIESFLQGFMNEDGYPVRVVNCGSFSDERALLNRICASGIKKGDIVVLYDENKSFDGIPNLNLADCYEREQIPADWVVDRPLHCNYKVNRIIAKEIYHFLEEQLRTGSSDENIEMPKYQLRLVDSYMRQYFSDFKVEGIVGSIVMNCNPFTKGHRYLIEQALEMVDQLVIFVVEEDSSLFTFKERYAMVLAGTKDLPNVKVVPSGNFILSQTTFPEYFIKVEDEDLAHNTEYDITLFAEAIAPKLNITYRFVGEEQTDKVTDAYNLAMKKILPEYGIQLVEIPRKKAGGEVISATTVRERLEHFMEENITDFIPESTRNLLVQSC